MLSRTKYPRTMNFPWSESNSSDDVWWQDAERLVGQEVVVTEKMDGECTTIYPDGHVHARSLETDRHPSRSWVKRFAAEIAFDIPAGWRICGENLYAFHSIFYTDLPSYFLVFGIYNEDNWCLSWKETEEICELLKLSTVPVLYQGVWDEKAVRDLWTGKGRYPTFGTSIEQPEYPKDFTPCEAEGYVARLADCFPYDRFAQCAAKYVRKNHVTTDEHWMKRKPIPNLLADQP